MQVVCGVKCDCFVAWHGVCLKRATGCPHVTVLLVSLEVLCYFDQSRCFACVNV